MIRPDLSRAITAWSQHLTDIRRLSPHTTLNYQHDLGDFLGFLSSYLGQEIHLDNFSSLEIQEFRAWLACRAQRGVSKRSNARALSTLRNFARFLERYYEIQVQGLFALTSPRLDKALPRPLTVPQAQKLVEEADTLDDEPWIAQRNKALFTLLYGTGLRLGEALNLNRGDLTESPFLMIVGKGKKERHVPLLEVVRQELQLYLQMCPYAQELHTPLFLGVQGKRLNATMAQKYLQRYRRLRGLPDSLTPHALRHSYATHLLQASGDLRAIQSLLGHASLSTTQIYTQLEDQQLLKAFEAFHPRSKLKREEF